MVFAVGFKLRPFESIAPYDGVIWLSETKSLYISREVSNFYGTEIEIWAGFGLVGNTEKKKLGRI